MKPQRPSHRISITKACKPLAELPSQDLSTRDLSTRGISSWGLERWFHKPSNLSSWATVELHLRTELALESATINLQRLEGRGLVGVPDEEGASRQGEGRGPENSEKIDYHWDITRELVQRNHLVLIWPSAVFPSHVFPPWFDLWLEIFDHDSIT